MVRRERLEERDRDVDDTVSEMSANQGTLSTAGTGNSEPLTKEYRQAHELRLNLIYSGFYLIGMIFLCLYDFSHFMFYPAIIFLILHGLLELRHDIVHKTRFFAHSRYTQASPNDRSYGGDLYVANLAQSSFNFLGMALFLLAVNLRLDGSNFGRYKAIYFSASLLLFFSGATTMLSRGCGSFYFLGKAPGFSIRDQTANFFYVTSTVLLLIIASWQIDHGVFDIPIKIGEYLVRLSWLFAAIHYTIADVNRLTKDNPGSGKGGSDAMKTSTEADQNDGSYTNYVEMGSAPTEKSFVRAQTTPASNGRSAYLAEPVQMGRAGSDTTRTRSFFLRGGEPLVVTRPAASFPSASVGTGTLDTMNTMATSHEHGIDPILAAGERPVDSPSTLPKAGENAKGDNRGTWKNRMDVEDGADPYCGIRPSDCGPIEAPDCTPVVLNPASGRHRTIPGRDTDSTSSAPAPETKQTSKAPSPESAGAPDKADRERSADAPPSLTNDTPPAANNTGQFPRFFGGKKVKKKIKTMFWRDKEIV